MSASQPVELSQIIVGERMRDLDADGVARLKESIEKIGLMSPITLRDIAGRLELVAGAHRLEAVRQTGEKFIEAIVIKNWSPDEARRWEISENLHRADLTDLQKSEWITEWIKLTEKQQAEVLTQLVAKPQGGRPESGVRAAARELNIGREAARRAMKVDGLTADAKKAAREVGLDDNQRALIAASRAEPDQQAEVLRTWKSNEGNRQAASSVRASKIDSDVKDRAAREVAEIIAEYIPSDAWDGLKANLYAAGASAIANALTNLTGQSIMDRRYGDAA